MAYSIAPAIGQQFFDNNGDPLSGGLIYTYQAGTTTPQATYTDDLGMTPNSNPVVLDSSGRASLWLDVESNYKFVIQTAEGATVRTIDNVVGLLTNNAVVTASIQDDAVTQAKIADDAVGSDQLRDDGSIDANRAVTTNHIRDNAITTPKIADTNVTLAKLAAAVAASLNPAGVILSYGGTAAPTGYLLCDGQSYPRADYPALFAAIGTAYGTASLTHFNVPDLRGQFLRGLDGTANVDPDKAGRTALKTGGNAGNLIGSTQGSALATHNHSASVAGRAGVGTDTNFAQYGSSGGTNHGNIGVSVSNYAGSTETRPTNVYVNFIIKT